LASRRKALGLIATHDLELTKLGEEIPGIATFISGKRWAKGE